MLGIHRLSIALLAAVSLSSVACAGGQSQTDGDTFAPGEVGAGGDGGAGGGGSGGEAGSGAAGSGATGGGSTMFSCGNDVEPPDEVVSNNGDVDPEGGDFTLEEALVELPEGPGPLRAILDTDFGSITCTMHDDVAPNAVANFIGLARGRRAFREPVYMSTKWLRRPFYDGLRFDQVLPGSAIAGGSPTPDGYGGPGYFIPDEVSALKNVTGSMGYVRNISFPDTNGSIFYIVVAPKAPAYDGFYTLFAECAPTSVPIEISKVEIDPDGHPVTPVIIKKVTVTRCAP